MSRSFPYASLEGAGNKIDVVDLRKARVELPGSAVRTFREAGEADFDQLMVLYDPRMPEPDAPEPGAPETDAYVRIFNADGSESAACGNGARCLAFYLVEGTGRTTVNFQTAAGIVRCRRKAELIYEVDMGAPRFDWRDIPLRGPVSDGAAVDLGPEAAAAGLGRACVVSMGNPHAVFWVATYEGLDIGAIGPRLERSPLFPERANISFARQRDRRAVDLRVWERGAGETKACGTAACATLAAGVRLGRLDREVRVALPGGDLEVAWRENGSILLSGPCLLTSNRQIGLDAFLKEARQ